MLLLDGKICRVFFELALPARMVCLCASVLAFSVATPMTATPQSYGPAAGARLFEKFSEEIWAALESESAYRQLKTQMLDDALPVIAAWWLVAEVENGGFDQYFWNSYGAMVDEAIAGLELSGQTKFADAARLAVSRFEGGVPFDRTRRMDLVDAMCGEDATDCFREAQSAFYAVTEEDYERYRTNSEEMARSLLDKVP